MSQLLQGLQSPIDQIDGVAAPEYFHNGLPFDSVDALAVDTVNAIDHYHQGLPFTALGRIVAVINGIVARIAPGGAPFDSGGRLVFSDLLTDHFSAGVAYTADNSLAALPPNELLNSSWAGGSGSVGGADWVNPTSWGDGFWPPDKAINEGVFDGTNTRLHLEAIANRGYLTQTLDGTPWIGQDINLSVFIDEVFVGQGAPIIGISGDATTIQAVGNSQTARRVFGVFNVTGASITIRCGMGITSNNTAENTLSRPQFTLGSKLLKYQPT